MNEYALKLEHVTKRYEDFCLNDISFSLPSGYIMGLIGENGAGKSTTIKAIMDMVKIDSGEITVLGEKSRKELLPVKEHIGVVMEECGFPENLNALDVHRILKRIYRTWDEKKFFSAVKMFALPEKKKVKEYSKGMKMKLSIAAALSHDSKLLILDEATSGLDPVVREEVLGVFQEFIQEESHAVFLSSHILSDLEKICDYITFIHKGRVMFSEPKDQVLEKYGILKCTRREWEKFDQTAVRAYRTNQFGVEALVFRKKVKDGYIIDPAGMEDIMLFIVQEEKHI